MFCISYGGNIFSEFMDILTEYPLVELRLDLCNFSIEQWKNALTLNPNIILTVGKNQISDVDRELILTCIEHNLAYVDLDIGSFSENMNMIIARIRHNNCKLIISYHNFDRTPATSELLKIIIDTQKFNPDIIKIACKVNSKMDCSTLLSLYQYLKLEKSRENSENLIKTKLVALGMGELGKITRITSLYLGSPFTYVSYKNGSETAEGQFDIKTIQKIIDLIDYGK